MKGLKDRIELIVGILVILTAGVIACLHVADSVSRDLHRDSQAHQGWEQRK